MRENDLYKKVKQVLEDLFKVRSGDVYFEITSDVSFSGRLKPLIPKGQDIVFNFLKVREARPDITGYVKTKYGSNDFIIVEVKLNSLKLDDVYQMRKYADLFNAKFAFLISPHQIPEELKRLISVAPQVLYSANYRQKLSLAQFDVERSVFADWYPQDVFGETHNWEDYGGNVQKS